MIVLRNPTEAEIKNLCLSSKSKSVKWIKDLDTNDFYFFKFESSFHADVAKSFDIHNYNKGIACID